MYRKLLVSKVVRRWDLLVAKTLRYWDPLVAKVERNVPRRVRRRLGRVGLLAGSMLLIVGLFLLFSDSGRRNPQKPEIVGATERVAQIRPGGLDPIVLTRSNLGEAAPRFLSATLLPGRGMEVFQITASIPGEGDVNLLASGDLKSAAGDVNSMQGGVLLAPWAGRLGGAQQTGGVAWRGQQIHVPSDPAGRQGPGAYGGLLWRQRASKVELNPMPDGEEATAIFASLASGQTSSEWPSTIETKVRVSLTGRVMELTVRVKNTGEEATPVGIGWAPRFAIAEGNRDKVKLSIPAAMREVMSQTESGMPTGELDAVKGTAYDFHAAEGVALGRQGLDDTFVHWDVPFYKYPSIELRNTAAGYGVRLSALSPSIKAVRVFSPADAAYVAISPQMNYDDPFARRWPAQENTGMVVLKPDQMAEWKVWVELFAL